MTVPRRQQISLDHTPYYHCTTRCVRRAFLCGNDRYSGRNFDHRKQWLEDRCKGRFWEGRYRCQALLDEVALVKCMAYVDLNPIRAAIATTPESSAHTSVKARIDGNDDHLLPFADAGKAPSHTIPLRKRDYLSLVDWSGRQFHANKRGRIPAHLPPILERLNTESDQWMTEMRHYGRWYYRAVGSIKALEHYCRHLGQQWLKGAARMAKAPV